MNLKQQAARQALAYVQNDMVLGLGTGSTTEYFIDLLGTAVKRGDLRGIVAVPTSEATAVRANELGIPLTTLQQSPDLDLAVDGADEVDPCLNLIKGLGKALLREKVVEIHARQFVVIVDDSKLVARLGTRDALPVEIVQFEALTTIRWLQTLGCRAELWSDENESPFITDNGNYLARCWFPRGIADLQQLAIQLSTRPGVVEHGLFLSMATRVIVAGTEGIKVIESPC
ncbi:MAG: ribose-5-phosphate isomerase RpiA [Chloroflexi bacterium]|nr:ribose-5-phosphate isomerase RpiA [Chloroflexota bacterium]